ncbi:alpha-methylacyl-CoA racemase isoform X2 [Octopus sinensis]|uniref:Alpha-methylacyl-CoA racemase isoform X2 n=1 Tax=Octopus sinensis TaxID=2607531 RepID=A0A7E6F7T3_9MOLL|nr:alpha-methylacyl-CoA racemase isoform X2 [Octopus sinensis]
MVSTDTKKVLVQSSFCLSFCEEIQIVEKMALKGLTVLEFAGLAPAPFCGMIMADFGARVIRIDRPQPQYSIDTLGRGKESICVDMKKPSGTQIIKRLCETSDVLIEPFRTGVMEKYGLGPESLLSVNPRLIYTRLSGFGQNGSLAKRVGHDINFLAISGLLSTLGRANERPHAPINLLGDFAGGSLLSLIGILLALRYRSQTGHGQVVDNNMTAGAAYLGSWIWKSQELPLVWGKSKGENLLDGGAAYYDTYETSDGKYMAVGALEPLFYSNLLKVLELDENDYPQFGGDQEYIRKALKGKFLNQTQKYWIDKFENIDTCCTPVLSLQEAALDSHNKTNKSFMIDSDGNSVPSPSPLLSKSPAITSAREDPVIGQHTHKILKEIDFTEEKIKELISTQAVMQNSPLNSKL